jgi:hypothetical protein
MVSIRITHYLRPQLIISVEIESLPRSDIISMRRDKLTCTVAWVGLFQ